MEPHSNMVHNKKNTHRIYVDSMCLCSYPLSGTGQVVVQISSWHIIRFTCSRDTKSRLL